MPLGQAGRTLQAGVGSRPRISNTNLRRLTMSMAQGNALAEATLAMPDIMMMQNDDMRELNAIQNMYGSSRQAGKMSVRPTRQMFKNAFAAKAAAKARKPKKEKGLRGRALRGKGRPMETPLPDPVEQPQPMEDPYTAPEPEE